MSEIQKDSQTSEEAVNPVMNFIVTGSAQGIGYAFIQHVIQQYQNPMWKTYQIRIYGLDVQEIKEPFDEYYKIQLPEHIQIKHTKCDVGLESELPDIPVFGDDEHITLTYLINNAGIQEADTDALVIQTNLLGVMNCTKKYAYNNPTIKSVVNLASVSAHNGAEFPAYTASKGGVISYTVNTAKYLAPQAICNSLSFGGVLTPLNQNVYEDEKWADIMSMTPMKKWMTAEEAAQWIYFVGIVNQSMTGQDIIVDNGETINHRFVW